MTIEIPSDEFVGLMANQIATKQLAIFMTRSIYGSFISRIERVGAELAYYEAVTRGLDAPTGKLSAINFGFMWRQQA